jgi:molybdenum cofactor cytidylyltransferase
LIENNQGIAIVVLAAGESSRFGSPKQLADWFGRPLLAHVMSTLQAIEEPCFVMLGAHQKDIVQNVDFNACELKFVHTWQKGMNASISLIAAELAEVNRQAAKQGEGKPYDGVLFLLGDQPLISTQDIRALISEAKRSKDTIVSADYSCLKSGHSNVKHLNDGATQPGVPAYFPAKYFKLLASLSEEGGAKGAKKIIESNEYTCVNLGERVRDVDTPDDLYQLQQYFLQTEEGSA